MPHPFDSTSPSPDSQHTARFAYSGEIRFGPPYFSLSVDASIFPERIFSDIHLWSPSSTLLAVQEWLTLDYSEGPITALTLIDLSRKCEASAARARKAFIVPVAFEGPLVVYRTDYGGQAGAERFEIDVRKITEWKAIG
jgi:hypothetical protein